MQDHNKKTCYTDCLITILTYLYTTELQRIGVPIFCLITPEKQGILPNI